MTTMDRPARSAADVLTWSKGLFDPALKAAADRLPESMRKIAGYHFGWWDEHGCPERTYGGKALRPTLVLLAGEAADGVR